MKRILAVLAAVAFVVSPVLAGDEAAPAAKDQVLKGKITKVEADKDGKKVVTYTLTTADAKLDLPAPKDGMKDDMLNVDVEVAVKAEMDKEGKKDSKIKETVSVKGVVQKEEPPSK